LFAGCCAHAGKKSESRSSSVSDGVLIQTLYNRRRMDARCRECKCPSALAFNRVDAGRDSNAFASVSGAAASGSAAVLTFQRGLPSPTPDRS
jgi:hypothetical protein